MLFKRHLQSTKVKRYRLEQHGGFWFPPFGGIALSMAVDAVNPGYDAYGFSLVRKRI